MDEKLLLNEQLIEQLKRTFWIALWLIPTCFLALAITTTHIEPKTKTSVVIDGDYQMIALSNYKHKFSGDRLKITNDKLTGEFVITNVLYDSSLMTEQDVDVLDQLTAVTDDPNPKAAILGNVNHETEAPSVYLMLSPDNSRHYILLSNDGSYDTDQQTVEVPSNLVNLELVTDEKGNVQIKAVDKRTGIPLTISQQSSDKKKLMTAILENKPITITQDTKTLTLTLIVD